MLGKPIFNISEISITKNILWSFLGVFFFVYLIISAVLFFHWHRYGYGSKRIALAEMVFLFVSVLLFALVVTTINLF